MLLRVPREASADVAVRVGSSGRAVAVLFDGRYLGCALSPVVEATGLGGWFLRSDGWAVAGLVPDGLTLATADANTAPVVDNAFVITGMARPAAIVLTGPAGRRTIADDAWGGVTDPLPPLRGSSIVSVEAVPSGVRLTASGASLVSSPELAWRVTVQNGGDAPLSHLSVTASLRYPGEGRPRFGRIARGAIGELPSHARATIDLPVPAPRPDEFGVRGVLVVRVLPVPGEFNRSNNVVRLPVIIRAR